MERIARFNNSTPFFIGHAAELLDRGLISSEPINDMKMANGADSIRVLTVVKAARDHVRETIRSELSSIDRRAMELYFGVSWRGGVISSPSGHRYEDPLQMGYKLANANALLIRNLRIALEAKSDDDVRTALRAISAYVAALSTGDHYRSIILICSDVSEILPRSRFETEALILDTQLASALRMVGEHERARQLLENADLTKLSKLNRRSVLLDLALCYEAVDDRDRATEVCTEIIALGQKEGAALQAESIMIGMDYENPKRLPTLRALEQTARKRGKPVLANTIALTLAAADPSSAESEEILNRVSIEARKGKDFYNEVRAVVRLAETKIKRGDRLTLAEKTRVIDAYHFLFTERLNIFDRCHDVLWEEFLRSGETGNLLRLFRHSSFVWRLTRKDSKEQTLIRKMAKALTPKSRGQRDGLDREYSYYLARASSTLLLSAEG